MSTATPNLRFPIVIAQKAVVPLTLTGAIVDGRVRAMSDEDAALATHLATKGDLLAAGIITPETVDAAEKLLVDISDHVRDCAARGLELRRPYNDVAAGMKEIVDGYLTPLAAIKERLKTKCVTVRREVEAERQRKIAVEAARIRKEQEAAEQLRREQEAKERADQEELAAMLGDAVPVPAPAPVEPPKPAGPTPEQLAARSIGGPAKSAIAEREVWTLFIGDESKVPDEAHGKRLATRTLDRKQIETLCRAGLVPPGCEWKKVSQTAMGRK